ncbi:MAG: phosphoribosylanthranilate isomerase [Phycisphaeraceae bacterium]|nr:phosphoribosylanthranilate isomerase [Phycisphaeraceae bacterium]
MIVKVKVCGITNAEDAKAAVDMGADILGFNFYEKSPRYVTIEQAAHLALQVPAIVSLAGVFVNAEPSFIREAAKHCHLDWVQLHGDETPEFCDNFRTDPPNIMKAVRIRTREDIERASQYSADAILLDAFNPEKYGGTGQTFDWSLLTHSGQRIFLAGGITPDNAKEAAEQGMYALDICSGIESEPGKKCHKKMQQFFDNIHHLRR